MIVRISGEGQYRLPDSDAERLNELDNRAAAPVERKAEAGFGELWGQRRALGEADGEEIGDDELLPSDVILPPRDSSFAEAAGEFTGEGLIPD